MPNSIPKFLTYCVITLFCIGCATRSTIDNWPSNLPQRSIFVDAFEAQKSAGTNTNTLEPHLMWIIRFYQGSVLYPIGWNRMTEILLDSLTENHKLETVTKKMYKLGIKISIEWAQDNRFRKIDSAAVAVWGNALRTAASKNEQVEFIDRVNADVDMLLKGELTLESIEAERYYPPEDYDDF